MKVKCANRFATEAPEAFFYFVTGKSIWCLACSSDERMIATGGGDSAIRLWLVEDEIENARDEEHLFSSVPSEQQRSQQMVEEIPRMIGLLHDTSVLVMTDKG